MKQSLKATLPKLNPIINFNEFITGSNYQNNYIAHCNDGNKLHLKNCIQKNEDILILIGPEGDFSYQEVELATKSGFTEISLGTARLRTETAGIVACNIVNLVNE